MSCNKFEYMHDWSERPLCRRYATVFLDRVQVGQLTCPNQDPIAMGWALGTLSDGQAEILGWWKHSESVPVEWLAVGAKLAARGAERIGVVVDDSDVLCGLDAFGVPKALAQSRLADGGSSASSLPPHMHRQVARARGTAKRIHIALCRAVQRRRKGEGELAAAALLAYALQRIDRRLSAQVAAPTARAAAYPCGVTAAA